MGKRLLGALSQATESRVFFMTVASEQALTWKSLSPDFVKQLREAGFENISTCMQCGTCTSSCPSGRRTAMRTRQLIRRSLLGDEGVLEGDDIWLCTTCYNCQERCPRDIKVTDAIILLRNMAAKRGHMLPAHKRVTEILSKTGHAVPINEENSKKRAQLMLPELPPTVHSHPDSLEEVKKLLTLTGFNKLVTEKK